MEDLKAIKLNADGMHIAASRVSFDISIAAKFAHACLTSAYNGEDWYLVYDDSRPLKTVDFTRAVMTSATFSAKFTMKPEDEMRLTFNVTRK